MYKRHFSLYSLISKLFWFSEFSSAFDLRHQKRETQNDTSSSFTGSGSSITELKKDKNGKIVVKVGHIGAIGALPNDDKILEISRKQLLDEGILGKDFDFEWVFGCFCVVIFCIEGSSQRQVVAMPLKELLLQVSVKNLAKT